MPQKRNSSTISKVITLSEHNDTALIVPGVVATNTRFNATSYASRAQCTSLNPQCQTAVRDGMIIVESCANIGRPELPVWGQSSDIRKNLQGRLMLKKINPLFIVN